MAQTNLKRLLKRHPFSISAHFDWSLALVYAWPPSLLQPLLPPGLQLDTYENFAFTAVALVQTRQLRPAFFPKVLGLNFFLIGHRIFTRYTTQEGRRLRGLKILRSATDSNLMVQAGNLLTHYHYHKIQTSIQHTENSLSVSTLGQEEFDTLEIKCDLNEAQHLPSAVFPDFSAARLFAGPMPFTFDYEPETHSILRVEGIRQNWKPIPVTVLNHQISFYHSPLFQNVKPTLANAFLVKDIDYQWKSGVIEKLK